MFRYEWRDGLNSVQMSPDVSLPQFVVIGHRQRQIEVSLSSGNYSRLLADVQFTRSMGYYMIQVYIPSSLIVVMSWVSFWLNRGAGNDQVMTFSPIPIKFSSRTKISVKKLRSSFTNQLFVYFINFLSVTVVSFT